MFSTSLTIQNLLRRMVDASAEVHPIGNDPFLSPFLAGSFNLYRGSALESSILFAENIAGEDGAPKRLEALVRAVQEPVTLVFVSISAQEKRSLIAARQGFVTEQGDMYLPQLALSLRADVKRKQSSAGAFSPAQQQAFLYCLLEEGALTQEGLREKTGMSAAGASRALSSLSEADLIDYEIGGKTGRKRNYFVPDKLELYRRGRKLFGNPVRSVERFPVSSAKDFLYSGLSALASRSALVAPACKVVAVGPHESIVKEPCPAHGEGSCIVQRLSYNPAPFAKEGLVDPFTMLMTIGEEDERISIALREALGGFPWYTD